VGRARQNTAPNLVTRFTVWDCIGLHQTASGIWLGLRLELRLGLGRHRHFALQLVHFRIRLDIKQMQSDAVNRVTLPEPTGPPDTTGSKLK